MALEWKLFLGENDRRQYNRLFKGCVYLCNQSLRAVVALPLYYGDLGINTL